MKRTALLLTIGIVILGIGGYIIYTEFIKKRTLNPWELVPVNTVAVYEASSCKECMAPVQQSSLWEIIRSAAFYQTDRDSLQSLLNFLTNPKQGSLSSMHITRRDGFDFVFYVPVSASEQKLFDQVVKEWKVGKHRNYSQRIYSNAQIHEISTQGKIFSWIVIDDVWVGSFTPFLVEDVIRTYDEGSGSTFRSNHASIYQLPKLNKDAGNIYVNLNNFSSWLSLFTEQPSNALQHLANATVLDVKADDHSVVLNGFTLTDVAKKTSMLSLFSEQTPTPFNLKQYVSNRTVNVFGISDGDKFGEQMNAYTPRKSLQDTLRQLASSLQIDFNALYRSLKSNVGVCYVESGAQDLAKILLIESGEQPDNWVHTLSKVSEKLSVDTVFVERYSGYEIREILSYKFPEKILWPFVSGFEATYFTNIGGTVIIGERIEDLKLFLEDIDKEDTWGKSVSQNKFLESTLLEANVSTYINTSLVWNVLLKKLNGKWKQFVEENQSLLNAAGMGAIQFSHLNENFYTNISWSYLPAEKVVAKTHVVEKNSTITSLEAPVVGKPFVVKSHVDKSNEVVLQDSTGQIHLISAKGKILWSLTLQGQIAGDIHQIDYFSNGKLQYFFATQGVLHIVDRLGNYVSPFPQNIPATNIEHVSLIDYDHSRKYRFLLSEKNGKLWMYDKQGVNLEGWQPKSLNGSLATPPQHHRIKGKDYIMALQRDGKAILMNRRGENFKGFPLNLNARPDGDYFLEVGTNPSNTYFVVVSKDGYQIKFNLEGKLQGRETLIKLAIESQFRLTAESNNKKNYIIVRQDSKHLSLQDIQGKEIISNDFVGMNQVDVQLYDFGGGKIYYIITDFVQNLTFIYNSQGKLLTSPPVESNFARLVAERENVILYFSYQSSMVRQVLF